MLVPRYAESAVTKLRVACAVVCAGALLGGAARAQHEPRAEAAFYADKQIVFKPAPIKRGRVLTIGASILGPVLKDDTPRDRRPNLYVVYPGAAHDSSEAVYNLVLSTLPRTDEPIAWDVYWAVVLDPALQADLRSERNLLLAAQDAFAPPELFDFDDLPGADLLRERLHIDSMAGLAQFRRPDGTLPRLLITPAHYTIKASAIDPDAPPPENRISRALSRLHKNRPAPPKQSATK